jgi:hypothetical protein
VSAITAHLNRGRHNAVLTSSPVRRFWPAQRRRGTAGLGTMQYLLMLLVAVTMACGVAATVTIELAPAYADASAAGY